jgi:hypothetical protein
MLVSKYVHNFIGTKNFFVKLNITNYIITYKNKVLPSVYILV